MSLAKINGVAVASIGKINGIAKASISKYNGIELPSGEVNTTIANNTYFTPDHYYDFNGDANDQVGSAHGTVYGATYVESGLIDGSYDFDGSNDYIDLPTSFLVGQNRNTYTYVITVRFDVVSADMGLIMARVAEASDKGQFNYLVSTNRMYSQDYNGNEELTTTRGIIANNTIYQMVFVKDATRGREIWINGSMVANNASYTNNGSVMDATAKCLIGCFDASRWWLNGKVSQLFSTTKALTSDDISWLYNDGNFRPGGYR